MKPQHLKVLRPRLASMLVLAVSLASPTSLLAAECEAWVAQILSAQGQVEVIRSGASRAEPVSSGETKLCPGDTLRAGALSKATLLLANQTRATIDEATEFTLPQVDSSNANCRRPGASNRPLVEILKGAMRFISRTSTSLEICAPYVNAAIEGTEFVVRAKPTENYVWVSEGRVVASNAQGSLSLNPGEGVVAKAGAALRRITIKPEDATQWSLYYPPVIDYRAAVYSTGPSAPTIANAIAAYRKNDLAAAFGQLEEVPEAARNAEYYSLRAGLLLSAGRVEEALAETEEALRIDPAQGIAYALQSIVAVTQNKSEEALTLAQKAQQIEPESSVPEIALSYAYQAKFDIEKARDSVRKAVELSPEDALAWSRLAELELSLGDLDEALVAAEKAERLDPDLARTKSVLGFARLTQFDIDGARTSFRKAIKRDPAAPLPHLGLGLALIREGELDNGTSEIETAAILDPDNSLIRSYLGKAYFEQKRIDLARAELAIAKELDPNDPTSWFYDAILKQTINRSAEALHDLQKSIDLNDKRAVHRSRLLLDEDQATRGSSLARIYDDLGFDDVARIEASKSLSTDPSNYSAHRFLSDSLAGSPREDIARVSEILQAQLLQPVNVNPVRPSAATTNLNTFTDVGVTRAAFNEFTSLFLRNQTQLTASGFIGNNSTKGDEVVLSGILDRYSYSVGKFHYRTDGFRPNNDVEQNIYDVYAQAALTEKFNVQFEYRKNETDQGDVRRNFDLDSISMIERRRIDQDTWRAGVHINATPHTNLVGSLIYSDRAGEATQDGVFGGIGNERSDSDGYDAQGQFQFRLKNFNALLGGGYYSIDIEETITEFLPDFEETIPLSEGKFTVDQRNAYLYSNLTYPENIIWTLGVSHDSFDDETFDRGELNYKVGLRWLINDRLSVRAASFDIFKRLLIVDQTIEPTQVAGFNQFFDDTNGTTARFHGLGFDGRLTENIYGGLERTWRNVKEPAINPGNIELGEKPSVSFRDRDEEVYRAYIYLTPWRNWAFSVEYQFEQFNRKGVTTRESPAKLSTRLFPVSIRYFKPSGFFAEAGVTYTRQKIWQAPEPKSETEAFSLLDASIGYKLAKRTGLVSLEIKNLLDEQFSFQDSAFLDSEPNNINFNFIPERIILGSVSISF